MKNSIRNHMLLIPGLLRCIDENLLRFLDSASAYAEIFIVTEKSFSKEVSLLVDRYNAKVWYAEDLEGMYKHNSSDFPGSFSQWIKFDYALNQALKWEEANASKFEFIHRIRTDVVFPDKFHELMVQPLENKDIGNICMLNFHDYCFSARRDALPSLLDLASFFQGFLHNDTKLANILKFVNTDQLKQSEIESARYLNSFAVGVLDGNQTPDEFDQLLNENLPSQSSSHLFIEATAAFALSLSDQQYMSHVSSLARKNSYFIRGWGNTHCHLLYSENILARFYNFFGIYTYCYSGEIYLKASRQANTDFTFKILQMVDNKDTSFLVDTEIDWEKEISDFLQKGGDDIKFCIVFTHLAYIHAAKFEDVHRAKLKIIFEILVQKCPRDMRLALDENFKLFSSERGLNLPSTDFYDCAMLAQRLAVLNRFDEAQAKIQESLDKLPNHIYLLLIANDVYRASGNLQKSLGYANKVILHHPSDWNGYGRAAQDLVELKRFDEAQAVIQKGLNKLTNQINLLIIANDIYRASGNRQKSLDYANSLILHHPSDWNGYGRAAQDLVELKRFVEAQAKIQEGLNKMPGQIYLLHIANDVYRASGDREKSLDYANSLIHHHPNIWSGYCRSAQDLAALKRFVEAQQRVQEGLDKTPNQIWLLNVASDIHRASGNREKSLEYANSLILHHPSDWNGYGRSAQDLVALKRFDEAQAKVREGLNKLPNQIDLLQIANNVYQELNKNGSASMVD